MQENIEIFMIIMDNANFRMYLNLYSLIIKLVRIRLNIHN